jgi:multiple sugar transport system ATP-binding protein
MRGLQEGKAKEVAEVKLTKLTKHYGSVLAVDEVDLTVQDRELFALLGPSGCGKSSTLRMIAGLEEITEGDIHFDGVRVNDLSPRDRDIAMAFENYALYPYLSVYKNIAFPLEIRNFPRDEIDRKVRRVAGFLGLDKILDQNAQSLSGGQQQRTGVARALVREPRVFVLDEPFSHLEAELRTSMRTELRRIHHEMRITTIYVTHDQAEAMTMADRIGVMNMGKLLQVGTPQEVYREPANEFVAGFVGEPAMSLISGRIVAENGQPMIELDGQQIKMPGRYRQIVKSYKGKTVRLGVRPSDVRCCEAKTRGDILQGTVVFAEPRNENVLINVEIGSFNIFALAPHKPEPQAIVHLKLNMDAVHLFDPETGANLSRAQRGTHRL